VPSVKGVAETPLFLNPGVPPASSRIYLDMAPNIRRVPVMTTWLEIEDIFNKELKKAFYGDGSVDDLIQNAIQGTQEFFQTNLKDLGT